MKGFLFFLAPVLILCSFCHVLYAQDADKKKLNPEFEKTKQLIVMINAESDGTQEFGAGIIVGRKKDELFIATAYHFLHSGAVQASKVRVQFRIKPGKYLDAGILKYSNEETMDLALISVKDLSKQGIDVCSIPFDRLGTASILEPGDGVFPLGNPNGTPWAMPVIADKIADILENSISFQSSFITKGNSGGALLDTSAGVTGLVVADQPPFGRAINIDGIINKLREWGYPVNLRTRDYRGQTPLHIAADKGDINALKTLLLSDCYNVNQRDDHQATPLHFAAYSSTPETISFLIKAGADLNLLDADGDPPLEWADEKRSVENIQLLVDAGAQWSRFSPLIIAGIKGDVSTIKTLLKDTNLIKKKDDHQATPMHYFAAYGSIAAAELLIKAGANLKINDEDDKWPIEWAAQSGRIDMIKFLLKFENEKDQKYIKEELVRVAISKGQVEVVQFLVLSGIVLESVNRFNGNDYLLTIAVKNKQFKMMEFLLKAGENPSEGGGVWDPPLHVAVKTGQVEAIKILKDAGGNINVKSDNGDTPLDVLLEQKWKQDFMLEVMEALVVTRPGKRKTVIDSTWSPGSLFLNNLKEDFVMEALKILIPAGVNVNKKYSLKISYDNYEHRTPLSLALEYGYNNAARFLREHGALK